jgi:hypothetical protein
MRELNVELVRLYDDVLVPFVPWKFLIEDNDWFWPRKWFLYPITDRIWVVKRQSPSNEYAKEDYEWIGIKIGGELVFKTKEWNNELVEIWSREAVLSIFTRVIKREYSGVVIEENCSEKEREEMEKMLRWKHVVNLLLEDRERILKYGEITFGKYIERYYGEWLGEFGEFFKELAKLKGEDRVRHLEDIKETLERRLYENGRFMHVYYP